MPESIRGNQAACLEPPKPRENDHRAAHHTSDPKRQSALKLAGVPKWVG